MYPFSVIPTLSPPPPPPPPPPPLPRMAPLPRTAAAFGRSVLLSPDQLERSLHLGEMSRLQRKLRTGQPITLAAIGASNTVRGGCEQWQGGKCATAQYTGRDADGSPHGWLVQTLGALNRTWPHQQNRLINHGLIATGPEAFAACPRTYLSKEVDAVVIAFADMCATITDDKKPETLRQTLNSTFAWSVEVIVRELLSSHDPPAIVFFNMFKWTDFWVAQGEIEFAQGCDAMFGELAQFYRLSSISMRNTMWHHVHPAHEAAKHVPFRWKTWTIEGGKHFDLRRGDRMAAELLYHWLAGGCVAQSAARHTVGAPDAMAFRVSRAAGFPQRVLLLL